MTRHHVWPKRFFKGKGPKQLLCAECHQEIEKIIPRWNKLTKKEYQQIVNDFLNLKRGLAV